LQVLQRRLEDVVEGGAQQAAEQVGDLGETADPQVDVVETGLGDPAGGVGPRAGAEHEVGSVGRDGRVRRVGRVHDELGGGPLAGQGRLTGDGRMGAVGGDEVDQ